MGIPDTDIARAKGLLEEATRVICVCHRSPDGDAIGSVIGIGSILEAALDDGKTVSFACVDPVPEMFHFLHNAFRIQPIEALPEVEGSLFIFVDCAEPKLTELHEKFPQLFDGTYKSIVFDHHPTNPRWGTVNFVYPDAASTCEIVAEFAEKAGYAIDSNIATALLTGVYTDTGGLLHSNVTPDVYRTVAKLLRMGARNHEVVTAVFRTAKLSTIRLWGRVLEKITLTEEGGAISAVTEGDFRATGADHSELTGAIDYVNAIPGMKFSLILSERDGKVKGSLRTLRDDVDVSAMAGKFSGGGHKKAAGFALPGKLKPEVRWKVVSPDEVQ
jgi:phosphoesterase RecJ-like protein